MVPNVYNNVKKNLFSSCNILGNSLKQGYLFTKKLKHNYSVFINKNNLKSKSELSYFKMSHKSLNILNDWLKINKQYLYASLKEKRLLAQKSNLSIVKLTKWLQNERLKLKLKKIKKKTAKILRQRY